MSESAIDSTELQYISASKLLTPNDITRLSADEEGEPIYTGGKYSAKALSTEAVPLSPKPTADGEQSDPGLGRIAPYGDVETISGSRSKIASAAENSSRKSASSRKSSIAPTPTPLMTIAGSSHTSLNKAPVHAMTSDDEEDLVIDLDGDDPAAHAMADLDHSRPVGYSKPEMGDTATVPVDAGTHGWGWWVPRKLRDAAGVLCVAVPCGHHR
ncbi:hypothetical protein HK097_002424 [Rhizophlyctis rosea]|uniref:Uncharacterized protein n=1 Tax=Rhizophlyctis rosea TaxID=64517 RepID=A0AAD5X7V7_9FUNG|nr:hypothetical protein HK097_002424 [Rhizophlyctis rosea]